MFPSHPSDQIEDFITFASSLFGAGILAQRRASDSKSIEIFVELAQLPLPSFYIDYLKEFGDHDAGLKLMDDCDSRLASLIDFYREEPDSIPDQCVPIAVSGLTGGRSLQYLKDNEIPLVVANFWEDVDYVCAQNFRNYVYMKVFEKGIFKNGNNLGLYKMDLGDFQEIVDVLRAKNFVPLWFSDDFQQCMTKEDGSSVLMVKRASQIVLHGFLKTNKKELESSLMNLFNFRMVA